MPDIYHRPIAFTERESAYPDTGAPGILRKEWRLVPFNRSNPIHYDLANRRQSAGRFSPVIVLEQCYIRRGTVEPWEIFDGYETETEALSDIDPKAVAIDCPALVWVQHDKAKREYDAEIIKARAREAEEDESRRLRRLSIDSWWKLYNDPRYRPLCDEWNEMTTSHGAASLKTELQADPEFMRLYNLAHRGAITARTKRAAIRACIDYYNFMWKYREHS